MLKTLTRCMPGIKLQCDVTRMAHILTKKLQNGISLYILFQSASLARLTVHLRENESNIVIIALLEM